MFTTLAKILPLVFFYLFLAFPNRMLEWSISPMGRIIAIMTIVLYTAFNTLYGVVVCAIVIFYYNLDAVEKTSHFDSYMLNGYTYIEQFSDVDPENQFRQKHCANDRLEFKDNVVKNENAPHIFPELEFLNEPCNPCDVKCGITIESKLSNEEELTRPKSSDNWVFNIWETWFSENNTEPFAKGTKVPFGTLLVKGVE